MSTTDSGSGMPTPLVSFRGVNKRYDPKVLVVDNLDVDIFKGEFLTLLGPSGSGKTTTLMMLAGFEWPDTGRILMEGADITNVPPHRRDMGVVFQSYALFPNMTVAENVAFPLAVRKVSTAELKQRVEEALALVHLEGFAGRRPAQLSGGQQQRVALARSLVYRPRLVLMDEPLGALDKALREQMQGEIKQIHRQLGVTFVYVTHDQDEALTMSDRVAVFHQGKIQQISSPLDIYNRPRTRFVASFLGETNMLGGKVTRIDGEVAFIRLPDGIVLRGRAGEGLSENSDAVLVVRPEAIGEHGGCENGLEGMLVDRSFHGDHMRVRVAVQSCEPIQLKLKPQSAAALPPIGASIRFTIPADEALILS